MASRYFYPQRLRSNLPVLRPIEIKIINWYLSKFLLDSALFFSLFSLYRIIKRIKDKLHGR